MQALRMLWRTWRGGQLGLILFSLILAVVVVSSVAMLAERVEKALVNESSSLLAADLTVRSDRQIPTEWVAQAQHNQLKTAQMLLFSSMVYHGDDLHLASVKAVEPDYPLRGQLTLSKVAFGSTQGTTLTVQHGPKEGEAWVDARMLPLLNVEIGDMVELGNTQLKVTQVLVEEPDRSSAFGMLGARVLMHWDDIAAAGVVQPGSRVDYRLLVAGEAEALNTFSSWLSPQLIAGQRITTPDRAEARVANTISRARSFLLLAGSIGVVLAGIALGLASRHFANQQVLQVALLKSWGLAAKQIRQLYWQQSLALGLVGSLIGVVIGYGMHELLIQTIREWLPIALPAAGWQGSLLGLATGVFCLLGFVLPALWHLPAQSPMAVLRQDIVAKPASLFARLSIGVIAIVLLMLWYSGSLVLTFSLLAGFVLLALFAAGFGYALLRLTKQYGTHLGSAWRLALANLWRRRLHSLIQMIGFSGAMALLMIMALMRTSLLDEWKVQLAEDAPNHFLVNVAPYELEGVKGMIAQRHLTDSDWYSIVRGRLVTVNGQAYNDNPDKLDAKAPKHTKSVDAGQNRGGSIRRELNLSWTETIPEGNALVEGHWWPEAKVDKGFVPVSVEHELAKREGFKLGDQLAFNIGGLPLKAQIVNTRSLKWDSMRPNFFFLFPEGNLEQFPRMYMTSLYIPQQAKPLVSDLLKTYPTILVIELDKVLKQIKSIVSQVTRGLEMMTLMILACGVLVMFAAVNLSMRERLTESAVLRTLGSPAKQVLGIQLIEFGVLGLIAGVLAVAGAELAVALLQHFAFSITPRLHPWLWLVGPLGGMLLIGSLGVWYARQAVVLPPLTILRRT